MHDRRARVAAPLCPGASGSIRSALVVLAGVAGVAGLGACERHAEPRWLIDALPGSYPEVVYYVPTDACAVALTIDDGVDPETTPAILDVLAEHDARATFFLVSESIDGNEALVERVLAEGHELGHHMTRDRVTVGLEDEELAASFAEAAEQLDRFGGVAWFRAGSGRYDDRVLELVRARGYRIAMASVFPADTLFEDAERMAAFVARMVEPGSVFVLHDRGERGRRSAETLETLLPRLQTRGYRILTLSELDALRHGAPARDGAACR